jgi:SPP1 family predicted phage head-tail adaptor
MSCAGKIDIGSLRHQIELQSETETKQGNGEVTLAYSTYDTVWASVRPMQGSELESAQQISAIVTHKIRIRYNSTIAPRNRIIFETRTFEIKAILDYQELHEYQDVLCEEIVQ